MKIILGFAGIFISTVLFLSIEINNSTIFNHIYKVISPATQAAQQSTEDFFERSISKTQNFSRKLYDNSVPKVNDAVKSSLSGTEKEKKSIPLDEVTEQEKSQLNDLIKSHR
jgi:hypothetical protein